MKTLLSLCSFSVNLIPWVGIKQVFELEVVKALWQTSSLSSHERETNLEHNLMIF